MERRLHTRHRARTTVYVVMSGRKSRICKAKNLSANGVFVETENLGLRKGQQVQLAFAINLGTGDQDPSPDGHCRSRDPRWNGPHDGAVRGALTAAGRPARPLMAADWRQGAGRFL